MYQCVDSNTSPTQHDRLLLFVSSPDAGACMVNQSFWLYSRANWLGSHMVDHWKNLKSKGVASYGNRVEKKEK